jgi:hypothetical protein
MAMINATLDAANAIVAREEKPYRTRDESGNERYVLPSNIFPYKSLQQR